MPDLGEPIEVAIRGDRMDVIGLVSFFNVYLDESDSTNRAEGRAKKVVEDFLDQVNQQENMALVRRELESAVENAEEAPGYRGIQVSVTPFDPKHPNLPIEDFPSLEDAEAYAVVAKFEDGFHAAGHPESLNVEPGLELASFMRMYARDVEEEVTSFDHKPE